MKVKLEDLHVTIDPGHSGVADPGAVGNGILESTIALSVSKYIEQRLQNDYGLKENQVQKTRTKDLDKKQELKQKTDFANKKKSDILVSIHCNSAGQVEGFESFRYINQNTQSESYKLQLLVHSKVFEVYKKYSKTDNNRGMKQADFHMLRESDMPSILLELAFISDKDDAAILANKTYQKEVGYAIADGIAAYFELKLVSKKCPTCGK